MALYKSTYTGGQVDELLGKAGTALQRADIQPGDSNGSIKVDGWDVNVTGLGTAAYVNDDTLVHKSGGEVINAPENKENEEQATITFNTSNRGALVIGKEGKNSGTMMKFEQEQGVTRLKFRSSATKGAMVWEQPEQGAQLYFDLGQINQDYRRIQMPSTAGTLALTSQIPTKYVTTDTDQTISGGKTFSSNVIIEGNLIIKGTTDTVNTTTLQVENQLIEVAHGNKTKLASPAGLLVPNYDGKNYSALVFDSTGTAYVGDVTLMNGQISAESTNLQALATRTKLEDGNLVQWDNENSTLVNAGKSVAALTVKALTTVGDSAAKIKGLEIGGTSYAIQGVESGSGGGAEVFNGLDASAAAADKSHAEGVGTSIPKGAPAGAHVEGAYNDFSVFETASDKAMSVVGIGTGSDSSEKKNGLVVRQSGLVECGVTSFSSEPSDKTLVPYGWIKPVYDWYEKQTYTKPTIDVFTTSSFTSGGYKLSSTPIKIQLKSFMHKEKDINKFNGTLSLYKGNTSIQSGIAVNNSSQTVNVTSDTEETLTTNTITYTLSGKDIKGNTISKTISVYGWYTSYIGVSTETTLTTSSISKFKDLDKTSLNGTHSVTTTSGSYVWFCTTQGEPSVTSSGFDVPLHDETQTIRYNGTNYYCYRTAEKTAEGTYTFVVT